MSSSTPDGWVLVLDEPLAAEGLGEPLGDGHAFTLLFVATHLVGERLQHGIMQHKAMTSVRLTAGGGCMGHFHAPAALPVGIASCNSPAPRP